MKLFTMAKPQVINNITVNLTVPDYSTQFQTIINKLDIIMTKQEQFDAALARINTATNDIAADIRKLKTDLEAGTVTPESLAKLDEVATTLEAIGAETDSSENPTTEV